MGVLLRVANFRLAIGFAACLLASLAIAAEPGAVHLAAQQRMLAQRIVKAYSQIGLNVLPTAAMNQLTKALSGFDENLLALDRDADGAKVKQALGDLALAWQPLKAGALSPVSQARALDLSRSADAVDAAGTRLVQLLQDQSDTPSNRRVRLAARQSMLCQRIAKAFMLLSWGVESASIREELDTASNEFSGGLNTLLSQHDNTAEIRLELDDMALQWEWLRAAIAAEGATSYRLIVAEATESILVSTERITRMYETAGAK